MNVNSYRFGFSGPDNNSYYGPYEVNDEIMQMDYNRRAWEYPFVMNIEEPTVADMPSEEIETPIMEAIPEECEFKILFCCLILHNVNNLRKRNRMFQLRIFLVLMAILPILWWNVFCSITINW